MLTRRALVIDMVNVCLSAFKCFVVTSFEVKYDVHMLDELRQCMSRK